jgi:predicted alpha/beta superfamily hydrolase
MTFAWSRWSWPSRDLHREMTRLALILVLWFTGAVTRGEIVFEGDVESKALSARRRIHIWLPPSYKTGSDRRYPVLYAHDGQNAFSTAGPGAAFGWGPWNLDKTAESLSAPGKIEEIIIVAIDCSRERYKEYRGPKSWRKVGSDDELYDNYARFLIEELKPKIDREYRTRPEPENTATLGSSMGGIVSMALGWEHPEVFGKIASLSGAFQVENRAFIAKALRPYKGEKKPLRIYLDSGRVDYSGGDDGMADTAAVARELKRIGWSKDLMHFVDPVLTEEQLRPLGLSEGKLKEALTSQHNELYWRLRAGRVLEFLFPLQR